MAGGSFPPLTFEPRAAALLGGPGSGLFDESGLYTEEMLVPTQSAGGLIGKAGAKIRELREQTGCNLKINSECEPGTESRKVVISGTPAQVQHATRLIKAKLAGGANAQPMPAGVPSGDAVTEEMMVQRDAAGGLIGKAGAKIAELREVTRCQIKIMENPEPGTDCRKVIVTGHPELVEYAVKLIRYKIQTEQQAAA